MFPTTRQNLFTVKLGVPLIFSAVVALMAFAIFWANGDIATDNFEHSRTAVGIWAGEAEWPPNFLFFALLGLVGSLIGDLDELVLTSCILLSLAVGAKAYLTLESFDDLAPSSKSNLRLIMTAALILALPIPIAFLVNATLHYFLGSFTPNVWHNSTTIFLMPFAILAFMLQARDFEERDTRRVPAIMLLVVVGIVVKPSFFFAFAPATALWLVCATQSIPRLVRGSLPVFAGGALTAALYFMIYHLQQGSIHAEASGIGIAPFAVWKQLIPVAEIPLAVFASFLAPITYFALGFRPKRKVWVGYASLLMAFALLLFFLVVETGPRATHGNFFWQTVVCNYILHMVLAADLLEKWSTGSDRRRVLICGAVFLAMALSGLVYLFRLVVLNAFLPY